ncbi:MAG: UTP--glucose-1-phosphate uridylyltransferase GalU [Xanthomonadales bacterium]|nr:UTP--glucose-1-phosphate uridylyltransferase GalU [Xanthomonadales bacterium]
MNSAAPIRKAVFPVAGMGTRFLPATKAVPKEMLPVVDRPLIQYAVEEAVAAGFETMIFVINRSKHAIYDHFERDPEMEARLKARDKLELLERVRRITPDGVSCEFVTQAEPLGLGHAVLCAQPAVGDEPFAVVLPDDMVLDPDRGALRQLVDLHAKTGASVLGVETVPREDTRKYGVVSVEDEASGCLRVRAIVEKPAPEDAPSNLAVVGRYVLNPEIFQHLRHTGAGVGGEIQLTDGIAAMLDSDTVLACAFEGARYECGSRKGFLKATIDYALANEHLREDLLAHLKSRLGTGGE